MNINPIAVEQLDTDEEFVATYTNASFLNSANLVLKELRFPGSTNLFESKLNAELFTIDIEPIGANNYEAVNKYNICDKRSKTPLLTAETNTCIIHKPVTETSIGLFKELFSGANELKVEKGGINSIIKLIEKMGADPNVKLTFSDKVVDKFMNLDKDNLDRQKFFEYKDSLSNNRHRSNNTI